MKNGITILGMAFLLGIPTMGQTSPARGLAKVIAHRGYWEAPGSAQNSIRSLVKADSLNCFGSEFDVWITPDDVLVVNHDAKVGDIVVEQTPSSEVLAVKLSNGENIPRLDALLQVAKNTDLRLVCELKEHKNKAQEEKAVKKIVDMMEKYGLSGRVDYISFSRDALLNFIKYAPKGTPVYYLEGDMTPAELKAVGAAGLDYSMRVMRAHPEWIKEAHELGLKVNIWTVNNEEDMQWCIDNGADFITTNKPERLFRLIW